ncbi:hypothetical protein SNE40_014827 [Patella caerulea]|uniref:Protein DD3-3 n=1 Tax=Patella caerulea TaxID=87958 RepID=A0AAN8JEC8_PATCE
MLKAVVFGFLSFVFIQPSSADIYFHNPRGSNNRLDETSRDRNNANRLFDSQNNARGGYNVGNLFYYAGSKLQIEWTNQHSCGAQNANCEIVLQYMCGDNVRDGAIRNTIPENLIQCLDYNCDNDIKFGMHEGYAYWLQNSLRERNRGLFTADQNLNGGRKRARNTRQNPNGKRRGYECAEERDYYPYWHPSPWKDIAVMTNDVSRCDYYKAESENVKGRWYCDIDLTVLELNKRKGLVVPNNKEDCDAFVWPRRSVDGAKGVWKQAPSHGLPAPVCQETEYSRDNHNGNGLHGTPNLFNWTLPNIEAERCVLRFRYNISTNDYDSWTTTAEQNADPGNLGAGTKVNINEKYGFATKEAADARGYTFKNDPIVKIFPDLDIDLALPINTAQYGRTFQDRTFTFDIVKRPADIPDTATIHNLNVRGKRGNIVENYPAVEYDFVPTDLHVSTEDYVHIQWTGSNTNNNGNDGQGRAGTDRNNLVLMRNQVYPEGNGIYNGPGKEFGHFGVNYPQHTSNSTLPLDILTQLAFLQPGQYGGEMSELDDAGTYFNLGAIKAPASGTYHYMCTRNNNFSNRDQKGRLIVSPFPVNEASIGQMGGTLLSKKSKISVEKRVFDLLHLLRAEEWPVEEGTRQISSKEKELNVGDEFASDFLVIYPQEKITKPDKTFTVQMEVDDSKNEVQIYRSNSDNFAAWTKVPAEIKDGKAVFSVQEGGVYVARSNRNVGLIVGLTIFSIVLVIIIVGAIVYFRKHPQKWQTIISNIHKTERSMKSKV